MEFITESSAETKEAGRKFATSLIEGTRNTFTAGLVGKLGSGKTTFVQGFAEKLGIKQRIISPTFILMRRYPLSLLPERFRGFYHVDLYRLEARTHEEILNLGLIDIWQRGGNIVLIEWAEKIKDLLPKDSYWLKFENLGEDRRKISINKFDPYKF